MQKQALLEDNPCERSQSELPTIAILPGKHERTALSAACTYPCHALLNQPLAVQRDVVASLHQQLATTTQQLQQEAQDWQDQCTTLEKELDDVRAEAGSMQQELKARPTTQQVQPACILLVHFVELYS